MGADAPRQDGPLRSLPPPTGISLTEPSALRIAGCLTEPSALRIACCLAARVARANPRGRGRGAYRRPGWQPLPPRSRRRHADRRPPVRRGIAVTRVAAPSDSAGRPRGSRGNAIMFAIIGLVVILFVLLGPGRAFDTLLITPLINALVFIALYRALRFVVGGSPESLVGLSQHLYNIPMLQNAIPLDQHFLWLNLGKPDVTYILPLIVGVSTYVQQKMSMTPNANPQQQQQQQMMAWMMPMMLFFLTLNLPSGVGVYWVTSNVFQLFAGYYVYGRRALSWRQLFSLAPADATVTAASKKREQPKRTQSKQPEDSAPATAPDGAGPSAARVRPVHGKRRGKRKNRR